jgi:hypothetical protein
MTDDQGRPRGERTHTQRVVTYSGVLLFCTVCAILWLTNTVSGGVALSRIGDFVFPAVAAFFAFRLWRELRER